MFLRYITSLLFIVCILIVLSCKNNSTNNLQVLNSKTGGLLSLSSRACYFADADSIEKQTQIKIDTPSCREIEQIQSIMEYAGLPQNFKIYRGNIDNALATVVNNQRLIIYNKDLFTDMDAMNSSYWTSLFIIAHEIGHHLADNISDTSNALKAELDADRFAGFILFRMGADSNQAIAAVASGLISSVQDSKTHPSKFKRIEAVKKSWLESYDLRYLSATPPPINDSQLIEQHYGFGKEWLIFNRFFLNKWGLKRLDYYDQGEAFDTTYLAYIPSNKIHLKGIITDVQKMQYDSKLQDVTLISIQVQLTQLDTIVYEGMKLNQRSNFLVYFEPTYSWHKTEDFYNFFIGGRRIDFDVFQMNDSTSTIRRNYILSAYAN